MLKVKLNGKLTDVPFSKDVEGVTLYSMIKLSDEMERLRTEAEFTIRENAELEIPQSDREQIKKVTAF